MSFSPGFTANLDFISAVTGLAAGLGVAKKYLEQVFEASKTHPRGTAVGMLGMCWMFALNMFLVQYDQDAGLEQKAKSLFRGALSFAAITAMLGPFLILTPTRPMAIKGKDLFQKLVDETAIPPPLTTKEKIVVALRWLLLLVLAGLEAFCAVALWIMLQKQMEVLQLLIVVVAYALVAIVLLTIFYANIFGRTLSIAGVDLVEQIRGNLVIKRTYQEKLDGKKDLDILAHKHYAKVYVLLFLIFGIVLLALTILLFAVDVSQFSSITPDMRAGVVIFFIINMVVFVWLAKIILGATFKPMSIATEVVMEDGSVVSIDKVKYVCVARLADRVALAKYHPTAFKDPQLPEVTRSIKEEVRYGSVEPMYMGRKGCPEWGGAIHQRNDMRCMFLLATGAGYTPSVALHCLQAVANKVAQKYYGYRSGFALHGPGSWSEPLRSFFDVVADKYSDTKSLKSLEDDIAQETEAKPSYDAANASEDQAMKAVAASVEQQWDEALIAMARRQASERKGISGEPPAPLPVAKPAEVPGVSDALKEGDAAIDMEDEKDKKKKKKKKKPPKRPPGAPLPPPPVAESSDEESDDPKKPKKEGKKKKEKERKEYAPGERAAQPQTHPAEKDEGKMSDRVGWPDQPLEWAAQSAGPLAYPSKAGMEESLSARVAALEEAAGLRPGPWRMSSSRGQCHPALLVEDQGLSIASARMGKDADVDRLMQGVGEKDVLPLTTETYPLGLVSGSKISEDGLVVEAAPNRTIFPAQCGIPAGAAEFYFEATSGDINMGIGFLPAMAITSLYEGDFASEGVCIRNNGELCMFGSYFAGRFMSNAVVPGDVLGMGWQRVAHDKARLWFTINGVTVHRSDATGALIQPPLPVIEVQGSKNNVTVNFGQQPFAVEKLRSKAPGNVVLQDTLHLVDEWDIHQDNASSAALAMVSGYPITLKNYESFYFEMIVFHGGGKGAVGLGLVQNHADKGHMPGWLEHEWGYHGDDGNKFCGKNQGKGESYGPSYTSGDVAGCLLTWHGDHGEISFTKNGEFLGVAFTNVVSSQPFFPAIGMWSTGARVRINVGQVPFVYRMGCASTPSALLHAHPALAAAHKSVPELVPAAEHGLQMVYDSGDAVTVLANVPIPDTMEEYYYEMEVLDPGHNGAVGLGLAPATLPVVKGMPGWYDDTVGYHGDDGKSYRGPGGSTYGPVYTRGDVVGCGYNRTAGVVYFTRNGEFIGVAFHGITGRRRPIVGIHASGARVRVNFGQRPFVFKDVGRMAFPKTVPTTALPRMWMTENGTGACDWSCSLADVPAEYSERCTSFMFEATIISASSEKPLVAIGWSTESHPLHLGSIRSVSSGFVSASGLRITHDQRLLPYAEGFGVGDCIGAHVDLETGVVSYAKNGVFLGVADRLAAPPPPADPLTVFPMVAIGSRNTTVRVAFGAKGGPPLAFDDAFGVVRALPFWQEAEMAFCDIKFEGEDDMPPVSPEFGFRASAAVVASANSMDINMRRVSAGDCKVFAPGVAAITTTAVELAPVARRQLQGRLALTPEQQRLVDARLALAWVTMREIAASMHLNPFLDASSTMGDASAELQNELRVFKVLCITLESLRWHRDLNYRFALARLRSAIGKLERMAAEEDDAGGDDGSGTGPGGVSDTVRILRKTVLSWLTETVQIMDPDSKESLKWRKVEVKEKKKSKKKRMKKKE